MLLHPLNDDAEQAERPRREKAAVNLHHARSYAATCRKAISEGRERDAGILAEHAIRWGQRAYDARRAEIDQWLEEIDAHTIRAQDLGAALEARELGGLAIQQLTSYATGSVIGSLIYGTYQAGRVNAHVAIQHARVALGEA